MAERWLYYYYHCYFSRTQPANPSSPQTTPATWERYNAWCIIIIIIIIDGTEGKYSPYFLKDAPAIDSFVEAAGQTVSYYLKAWKIFWTFTLTLTPLSFVARDPLLKPSCAIYLTFEKNGQVEMRLFKKNGNMFTVPLAKFNFGLSFALVLFVIKHKKHLLSYLQYLWLSFSWLFL